MQNCFIKLVIVTSALAACNNQAETTSSSADSTASNTSAPVEIAFDKMVGTWQNTGDKSFERWTKNDNGTYRTVGFIVKGSDTVFREDNQVYQENSKWVSENKVAGQNDGKSVKFTESLLTPNSFQFSNPAHDFPTDIHYEIVDANTVSAYIVGPNNKGGKDTIPFNFIRVK